MPVGQGMNASMNDTHNLSELLRSLTGALPMPDCHCFSLEGHSSPERFGGYFALEDSKPLFAV